VIFQHTPLPPFYWAGLILFGPVLYTLERTRKNIARWMGRPRSDREEEEKQMRIQSEEEQR
jgi:hypothetical protein